jgi:hypothetical protein
MERISEPQKNVIFDQNEEPIVLSKHLLEILFQDPHPADVVSLFIYCKHQNKNTPLQIAHTFHWSISKVVDTTRRLSHLIGMYKNVKQL